MRMKRYISMFCVIAMFLSAVNISVYAEEIEGEITLETVLQKDDETVAETMNVEAETQQEIVKEKDNQEELTENDLETESIEEETAEETEETTETESVEQHDRVYYTNPLYEDLEFVLTFDEELLGVQRDLSSQEYLTEESYVIADIRNAMINRINTHVAFYESTKKLEDGFLDKWINAAMAESNDPKGGDYIRFHLGSAGADYTEEQLSNGNFRYIVTFYFMFLSNGDQENAVDSMIGTLLTDLNITEDMSDYRKIKVIYDFICQTVNYDYGHKYDDTYFLQYTAYAALFNRMAVCQGYANLFYRLMKEVGVDVRTVTGISFDENHAWNIVKLDGKYYYVDSTWDAGMSKYSYFLKGSSNFKDHTNDTKYLTSEFKSKYPISTSDYVPKNVPSTVKNGFQYSAQDGQIVIEKYVGTEKNVTIPSQIDGMTVTEIAGAAFATNSTIESVTIPASIVRIGRGNIAFDDMQGQYETTGAFSGCSNLKKVVFASGSKLKKISECTFANCIRLTQINLPSTIEELGLSAFEGCTALTTLSLQEGLVKIDQNAISNTGITSIHLPSTLTEFDWANACPNLQKITVADGNLYYRAHEGVLYEKGLTHDVWTLVYYPEGKTATSYRVASYAQLIMSDVFSRASGEKAFSLKTLYIGNCNAKGYFDGYRISRIRCTVIPDDSNPYFKAVNNVILSKDGKVLEQIPSSLTGRIIIPEGVEQIASYAGEVGRFSEVILPQSVREIGNAAFWECKALEYINIPKTVTLIGDSAFQNCQALKEISIPEGVTRIKMNTFFDCWNLRKIGLPKSLKLVEDQAFLGCSGLKIYYAGTQSQWKAIDMKYANEALKTYYASIEYNSNKTEYMSCSHNWKKQRVAVEPTYKTEGICIYACSKCLAVREEVIPCKPLGAPTGVKAVSYGKNRVKLSWKAVTDAHGYLIYAQKNGKYAYVGMTAKGTTYIDTKALDLDYNFYWVFPYVKGASGKMYSGACSKYVYAKGVCPAVTNLKASSVTGGVKLTWNAAAGAEGYLVYGIENNGTYGYVGMTTGTTYTAKKASKTVYNYYWIFPYHKNVSGKMITGGVAPYTYGRAR